MGRVGGVEGGGVVNFITHVWDVDLVWKIEVVVVVDFVVVFVVVFEVVVVVGFVVVFVVVVVVVVVVLVVHFKRLWMVFKCAKAGCGRRTSSS